MTQVNFPSDVGNMTVIDMLEHIQDQDQDGALVLTQAIGTVGNAGGLDITPDETTVGELREMLADADGTDAERVHRDVTSIMEYGTY